MESAAQRVGQNVKRLRHQRGMSLAELGRVTNLAKGTLAAIEQGRGNPTVETLNSLTRGLGATMGELVADDAKIATRVIRDGEGSMVIGESMETRLLSRTGVGGVTVELYATQLDAGRHQVSTGHSPGVREELIVISGRVRAGADDDLVELAAGDYAGFPADVPHRYEAVGDEPVKAILIMHFPQAGVRANGRA
jgi:transcriptional regulator with XRE-family HTH domain